MLCRLMSLLVYKYGLYPAFEKAGISPDFVLKRCIAHLYLERSHLGLFFKLFYRTFAKCPEKIGDIESLYRELQPLSLLKIYLVERL
mgnify:CR=1 FL=1